MNIGRIIYRVQAMEAGIIPVAHGKLLHGAMFNMLNDNSTELAANIHDNIRFKPFTLSPLRLLGIKKAKMVSRYRIKCGQLADICLSAFSDELIQAFSNINEGYIFEIGKIHFRLQCVFYRPEQHEEAVILSREAFMAGISSNAPELIKICYITPTTFRIDTSDYPFPEPRLVWGSLAMKWNQLDMPESVDVVACKALAEQVVPWRWSGNTERLIFNKNISVTGFVGTFTYSLFNLEEAQKRMFCRLACFAEFSGIGRLTAQGMGQVRVENI